MPALATFGSSRLTVSYALGSLFGFGPRSRPAFPLAVGLVRLTEKVTREYQAARTQFRRFSRWHWLGSFFRGVNHLETCLNSLHRAAKYAEALRRLGLRKEDGKPLIAAGRGGNVLSTNSRNQIRDLRDALEHMDERIVQGKLPVGKPTAADPAEDRLRIEDLEVTYFQIAEWIRQMHTIASTVMDYREPDTRPTW